MKWRTLRAFINIDHIEFDRWAPPLADADWRAFFQAMYKGIEGEEWEELSCYYRDTSKATGAKKPSESQKSKSPLGNEGGQRQGEMYYDPARKADISGRTKTRLGLWEEHLKDPIIAMESI